MTKAQTLQAAADAAKEEADRVNRLRDMAGQIENRREQPAAMTALIDELKAAGELSIYKRSGVVRARLLNLDARSQDGEHQAMINWANKARRALLAAA